MNQIPDELDRRLAEQRQRSNLRHVEFMEWVDQRHQREKRWRPHYAISTQPVRFQQPALGGERPWRHRRRDSWQALSCVCQRERFRRPPLAIIRFSVGSETHSQSAASRSDRNGGAGNSGPAAAAVIAGAGCKSQSRAHAATRGRPPSDPACISSVSVELASPISLIS